MLKKTEPGHTTPSLESVTVRAKYEIQETDFTIIFNKILTELSGEWHLKHHIGDSFDLLMWQDPPKEIAGAAWIKYLSGIRSGIPAYLSVVAIEHHMDSTLVEVECHPSMWHIIAYTHGEKIDYNENEIQEALLQCKLFVQQVMSIFRGKEVEPASVYPIIPRMEVKSRLLNLGLDEIVDGLDKAERHIVQNNFPESLNSSRTAFEKMIDWQMKKRGLDKTNSYTNDIERLKSKGYLDKDTAELFKSYYGCISNIGVHEKGAKPGIYEAQMGYGLTLIMLDYFANKLP